MNSDAGSSAFITQTESTFHAASTSVKFRAPLKTYGCMIKNKPLNGLTEQSQFEGIKLSELW